MDLSGFFCVLPQKCSVIFLDIVVCRDRDKQIPPVRPDFILNILSEHSHNRYYTHHFFIRTFINYLMLITLFWRKDSDKNYNG